MVSDVFSVFHVPHKRRRLKNPDNIEPEYKWIFDFDHVMADVDLPEELRHQYRKSPKADEHLNDKHDIEKCLQNLNHEEYREYTCTYRKGNAHLTAKREGRRNLGVGYVTGLEAFEKQVEEDLMSAIKANFSEPDVTVSNVKIFVKKAYV